MGRPRKTKNMSHYVNRYTGRKISEHEYSGLSTYEKEKYSYESNNSNFITSALIGTVTDSALLGGLLGGDIVGGVVGDMLDGDLLD